MLSLYNKVCHECSRLITHRYSTSFSLGIRLFAKRFRSPIYAIYGFVRFADEIVDTFHDYDKEKLLAEFRQETKKSIENGISLNPVLHTFQEVVNEYDIEWELIDAFLYSMKMDLQSVDYTDDLYKKYIYGSAEVVGLMCLKVFLKGQSAEYNRLRDDARALGSAFQKINFLRDIRDDYHNKGRTYFPNLTNLDHQQFSDADKKEIEEDIAIDFKNGLRGILELPKGAKFGVYIAYKFYHHLFLKIQKCSFDKILSERVRVKNRKKALILAKYSVKNSLNLI